jgi:hypothetical protein
MDVAALELSKEQENLFASLAMTFELELGTKIRISRSAINLAIILNAALINNEKVAEGRKKILSTLNSKQRTELAGLGARIMHPSSQENEKSNSNVKHKFGARS